MKIRFYKTDEFNGSSYVKIPLTSNALITNKNNDKYCFFWSILASLYPCDNDHPNRVSNYKQYFNGLNINDFDYSNGKWLIRMSFRIRQCILVCISSNKIRN